ncbi:hypothetical protein L6164_013402 [Bauhinia variegata]|uniref:Uncharacterized protein n=1 Tax=Bauhinia variegata TaxID=167791 RepID=A0ACB9NEU5_BAUVA|nr:hypothetical protein L6164_013402 [Bauhinia variegata]
MDFLVVKCHSPYNVILDMPILNQLRAIVSTRHLLIKYPTLDGKVKAIKGDHVMARELYHRNLTIDLANKQEGSRNIEKGEAISLFFAHRSEENLQRALKQIIDQKGRLKSSKAAIKEKSDLVSNLEKKLANHKAFAKKNTSYGLCQKGQRGRARASRSRIIEQMQAKLANIYLNASWEGFKNRLD